jgi:BASS family bile acid:Na+ symporter
VDSRPSFLTSLSHFVHRNFLWFVLGSYALASVRPMFGLLIRDISFGEVTILQEKARITLPMVLLACLLANAGLGVRLTGLGALVRSPRLLLAGLAANLLIPIAFVFGVSQIMQLWHNPDEVQNILVGLALVASMPIAGSSTAWSQNANGDLALSLGLVLLSTFLSPLTTPVALHAVGWMATGDYAQHLHELAGSGTGIFLTLCVLLPSALGILGRQLAGEERIASAKPILKLANSVNLLLLNYSNASVSLPQTFADPDWDFLAATLAIVVGLCCLAFASGWLLARFYEAKRGEEVALMFGLGMNNNGTGLVLASLALADHPRVMLPIIFYNLVQHLVAGGVDFSLSRLGAGQRFCAASLNGSDGVAFPTAPASSAPTP